MRNRIVQNLFLGAALFLVSVIPVAAQTDAFSVGVALLSDSRGVGVNADYSRATRTRTNDQTLGWVGDFSFSHKGFDDFGVGVGNVSINTFMVDGGIRLAGKASDKATWHVQGTAGIVRTSGSSDLADAICNSIGIDCGVSDTGFLIMPGGALTYWFSEKGGIKGQLNIPIVVSGNTGSAVRFDINYVMKLGR